MAPCSGRVSGTLRAQETGHIEVHTLARTELGVYSGADDEADRFVEAEGVPVRRDVDPGDVLSLGFRRDAEDQLPSHALAHRDRIDEEIIEFEQARIRWPRGGEADDRAVGDR